MKENLAEWRTVSIQNNEMMAFHISNTLTTTKQKSKTCVINDEKEDIFIEKSASTEQLTNYMTGILIANKMSVIK